VLEPTIYHTRGEHANHYTIDGVNSHRNDDNINMDEPKEPVNDVMNWLSCTKQVDSI